MKRFWAFEETLTTVSYIDEEHVPMSHIDTFPLAPCFSYSFQNKKNAFIYLLGNNLNCHLSFH